MGLVTLARAKLHLREDSPDADDDVALKLAAAEEQACEFLGRQVFPDRDALVVAVAAGTAGPEPMVVNASIASAILLILGHLYENRSDVTSGTAAAALPMGSRHLLQPFRIRMGV